MILNKETHARNLAGGGVQNPQQFNERRMLSHRGSVLYRKKRGGHYLVSTGVDVL